MNERLQNPEIPKEAQVLLRGLTTFMRRTEMLSLQQEINISLWSTISSGPHIAALSEQLEETIEENVNQATEVIEQLSKQYGVCIVAPQPETDTNPSKLVLNGLGYDGEDHVYYGLGMLSQDTSVRCELQEHNLSLAPLSILRKS